MKPRSLWRFVVPIAAVLILFAIPAQAAKPNSPNLSCTITVLGQVFDEQDTTLYYNNGTTFCSGTVNPVQNSAVLGDQSLTSTVWDFTGWTAQSGVASSSYVDGSNCGNNCLRAYINSNNTILTLDTRGTSGPRQVTVGFAQPCGQTDGCPGPAGSSAVFGGSITTPALLNVYLNVPYTSMAVCTSTACPEAEPAFAKLWFNDPSDSSVQWRIDWAYLRVLRLSANAWYVIADACDGGQIAGLSRLQGTRTRPKTVFNGYYKIPFFLTAIH